MACAASWARDRGRACTEELLDLGVGIPELGEHLPGVRACGRYAAPHGCGRVGERQRRAEHLDRPAVRVGGARGHPEVLHLGIREHLVHLQHRAARHEVREELDPLRARTPAERGRDLGVELVAVRESRLRIGEARVAGEVGRLDQRAERLPVAERGDVHVTVGRRVGAHRHERRVLVADLLRHLVVDQPTRGLEVHEADHRLEQRRAHPLATTGAVARDERGEHPLSEERARRGVGDRDADARRSGTRRSGHAHHAAEALCDLVDTGTLRVRAVLAEAGDARVHETRVHRQQRLGIDAQVVLHRGPEVLDQHVGPFDQPQQHAAPVVGREVEQDRPLVAVQVGTVGAFGGERRGARGSTDLHHVGAEVGELAHARRSGACNREVDDADTGEGSVGHGRHAVSDAIPAIITKSPSTM